MQRPNKEAPFSKETELSFFHCPFGYPLNSMLYALRLPKTWENGGRELVDIRWWSPCPSGYDRLSLQERRLGQWRSKRLIQ